MLANKLSPKRSKMNEKLHIDYYNPDQGENILLFSDGKDVEEAEV